MTTDPPALPAEGVRAPLERLLATRHFVFLHVPRTGGGFIRHVCLEHLPKDWFIPNSFHHHVRFAEVRSEFAGLPMIVFVRNPWDWYVSWYHWFTQVSREARSGAMWRTAFGSGRNSFKETVINACTGRNFSNRATSPLMQKLAVDHYTALFTAITQPGIDEGRVEVGRFETLHGDFLDFLARHDVPVSESFVQSMRQREHVNVTAHGSYREYYDDELRDLVGRTCKLVTEFGYSF